MKKSFLSYVSILLVISPVLVSFLWHINNQGWPTDDAAQYAKTAYHQYLVFQNGSLIDGFKALYQIRGWRPTLYPVLATPFFLLFKGNILAATGATLVLCFFVCQVYIYAIARRYLDSLRASLAAALVGSCPAVIFSSMVFFSEIAWLAFFAGFIFHLLESEYFRKPFQATIAGIFLGLSGLVRPAENITIAILPLIGMIAIALHRKVFSFFNLAFVTGFVLLSASLLVSSVSTQRIDYRLVIALGIIIALSQLFIIKADKEMEPGILGLNLFSVLFMLINLLWWADSMPQLYSWVYNTSFGAIAQVTDVFIRKEGFFSFLKRTFYIYLFPQGILVTALCLVSLLPDPKRILAIRRVGTLAMITLGLLLPIFLLYAFTGTSDPRRIFIGMSFLSLFLAIFSLQDGFARKARDAAIVLIVAMQIAGLLWSVKGEAPASGNSLLAQYHAAFRPQTNADQNEAVVLHLMDLGVPKNSTVAVYTMALFHERDRIYEPNSLDLAALTTGSNLHIIYCWDIGDYFAVIKKLRETGVSFLLIDVYEDIGNKNRYQPYVQFATALLAKMKGPYIDPPELKRVAAFKINGREQVLFEVLPF